MEHDPYLLWGKPLWGDSPSPVAPGTMYRDSIADVFSDEEIQKLNLGLTLLLEAQS